MINGFHTETKPLTEIEQKLLPIVVRGLSKKTGSVNAVTNKAICEGLKKTYNVDISEVRIRKIINHIRNHSLLPGLVANGCGYYITNNLTELKEYDKSLAGRENAIHAIRMRLKEHIVNVESKQQYSLNYK